MWRHLYGVESSIIPANFLDFLVDFRSFSGYSPNEKTGQRFHSAGCVVAYMGQSRDFGQRFFRFWGRFQKLRSCLSVVPTTDPTTYKAVCGVKTGQQNSKILRKTKNCSKTHRVAFETFGTSFFSSLVTLFYEFATQSRPSELGWL